MMTKCFADMSLIKNPVARIVKFERRVKIFVAKFKLEVDCKIGSKIM